MDNFVIGTIQENIKTLSSELQILNSNTPIKLSDLLDVSAVTPADGDTLVYNVDYNIFEPKAQSGGSGGGSGVGTIALGIGAGQTTQGDYAVAIGFGAGNSLQLDSAVAIGRAAGNTNQGDNSVAIGYNAGQTTQGNNAIALGMTAGKTGQLAAAVAIGELAGETTQGSSAVAIGVYAGQFTQGNDAIALGRTAGNGNQGINSVAIGHEAGKTNQGDYSVAIGYRANNSMNHDNTVVINGSVQALNPAQSDSTYIKPIRSNTTNEVLYYDNVSGEVTRGAAAASSGGGAAGTVCKIHILPFTDDETADVNSNTYTDTVSKTFTKTTGTNWFGEVHINYTIDGSGADSFQARLKFSDNPSITGDDYDIAYYGYIGGGGGGGDINGVAAYTDGTGTSNAGSQGIYLQARCIDSGDTITFKNGFFKVTEIWA